MRTIPKDPIRRSNSTTRPRPDHGGGGKKEDPASPNPVNEWCELKRVDLYDQRADDWRQLSDMGDFREYHAIMLLLPDGRVLVTAGTGQQGLKRLSREPCGEPPSASGAVARLRATR